MNEVKLTLSRAALQTLFRNLRAQTSHTQYTLAKAAGVHRNTIYNLERGSKTPDLRVLVAIAEVAGYEVVLRKVVS